MIMSTFLVLVAFFLAIVIVFLVFAGAINFYVDHNHKITLEMIFRLIAALCGYTIISIFVLPVFFMLLFVQAHSQGELLLTWEGKLFYYALLFIYAVVGWLLASLASAKLITFRSVWERSEIESIWSKKR